MQLPSDSGWEHQMEAAREDGKKLLTISDISEYLNIKVKTIYAKVEAGEIPHYRIGRLVRFRLVEIDAWLEDCRSKNWQANEQHKPRNRRRRASNQSNDDFSKIVTKIIDEETNKYYSLPNGKSDRIKGPKQEVQHGSI
jgi:excisionase family DNA binding protein